MKCDNCSSNNTYIKEFSKKYNVKGKEIEVITKRRFCSNCHNLVYDDELDSIASNEIIKKYNNKYGISGDKIIELRNKYNLSQELFAKVIGCAKKTLISYEKGTSIPNDTNTIILNSLFADPGVIEILIESNKDQYSDKEYIKIRQRIVDFLNQNKINDDVDSDNLNEFNGYTPLNIDKVINMILFFAKDGVLKTKLLKEMFYSDFLFFKQTGSSITGLEYAKIIYGPVPNNKDFILDNCINNSYIEEIVKYNNDYELHNMVSLKEYNKNIFNNEELDVLNKVKLFFKDFGSKEIADFSHEEKGYIETTFSKNISYDYAFDIDRL